MKALVFAERGRAIVTEITAPVIGPAEVLIAMRTVGLCHSDFTLLQGDYIFPVEYPIVPGHEWVGEIVEVGAAVTNFRTGDRVVGECAVTPALRFGFNVDGALAELFKADSSWIHRLPHDMDDTMGALVEPFTIAYSATRDMDASDTVVILGAGPIGLCAMASAAAKGSRVIAVEPDPARAQLARTLGAEDVLNPVENDVAAAVQELTDGRGADIVIEASGNARAMASTYDMATFGGRIVNVGINVHARAEVPLGRIVQKALNIRGLEGSAGVWPAAIRFLSRTGLDLSPLVSKRFALVDAVQALEAAERRAENIKVHVTNDSR